jgi:hypothetical protein
MVVTVMVVSFGESRRGCRARRRRGTCQEIASGSVHATLPSVANEQKIRRNNAVC